MILLVEDKQDDVELTLRAFRKHHLGNQITVAMDGEEALLLLEKAAAAGKLPALVLLDLKLPKLDGLEVLRRIRGDERTRLLPVVMLMSSCEDRDVAESYRLGANSVVCKPASFTDFIDAAGQISKYWLLLNQQPPLRDLP